MNRRELMEHITKNSKLTIDVKKPVVQVKAVYKGKLNGHIETIESMGWAKWSTDDMTAVKEINKEIKFYKEMLALKEAEGMHPILLEPYQKLIDERSFLCNRLNWNESVGIEKATGRAIAEIHKKLWPTVKPQPQITFTLSLTQVSGFVDKVIEFAISEKFGQMVPSEAHAHLMTMFIGHNAEVKFDNLVAIVNNMKDK